MQVRAVRCRALPMTKMDLQGVKCESLDSRAKGQQLPLHRFTVCTGLRLKPYTGEISGLELQPVTPFPWSEAPEGSQASHYLPHIGSHIQQILHDKKYCMYDARRYKTLLTVSGMYCTSRCRHSLACTIAFLLLMSRSVAAF